MSHTQELSSINWNIRQEEKEVYRTKDWKTECIFCTKSEICHDQESEDTCMRIPDDCYTCMHFYSCVDDSIDEMNEECQFYKPMEE